MIIALGPVLKRHNFLECCFLFLTSGEPVQTFEFFPTTYPRAGHGLNL